MHFCFSPHLCFTYFCYDEWLSVLQSSLQRESPRSASVELDVDVIKGHELFHGLHAGLFHSSLTLLTTRTRVSPSLTTTRYRPGDCRGGEACAAQDGHAEPPREGNASGWKVSLIDRGTAVWARVSPKGAGLFNGLPLLLSDVQFRSWSGFWSSSSYANPTVNCSENCV